MQTITIITPTFNRKSTIERLYNSLLLQNVKDFCWYILDDGSTDNTEELIKEWQQRKEINITYIKQENGGKHTALNKGIPLIETELTFIVDSDDYLPENAIEIIYNYHLKYKKYKEEKSLCGYSFLRFYSNGEVNTAYFPKDEEINTYLEVRINGGIGGDKAEVFYTEILKKYPFPTFEGEKFMPEDVVWMQMSEKYHMVHINECIYYCDYLEGGLTKSGRKMKIKSPKAMCLRSKIYLNNKEVCLKTKIKMMLLYIIYGKVSYQSSLELFKEIQNKGLYILCYIPASILYLLWSSRYK